jgi:hypothetical protein
VNWFTLTLSALATYRLARLVAVDLIGAPLRRGAARLGQWAEYLAQCPWCLSIWLSPGPVVALSVWPQNRLVLAIIGALAISALVGTIHALVTIAENRADL